MKDISGEAAAEHAAQGEYADERERAVAIGAAAEGLVPEERVKLGLPPTQIGKLLYAAEDGRWVGCTLVEHLDTFEWTRRRRAVGTTPGRTSRP